jgi:hypothetical protein
MSPTIPPDGRLDGPVHTWFGLSYSNYQVLHRTLMQSMPIDWQQRMVACLDELRDAFDHIEQATCYIVEPAVEVEYSDLTKEMRKQIGVDRGDGDPDQRLYYDRYGTEHEGWERALVPTGRDPVPHYNRGRTYIEPASERHRTPMIQRGPGGAA